MGILSGLDGLGLGSLEGMDIFEEEKKEAAPKKEAVVTIQEKDLIYEKNFTCPVCDAEFSSKIMKTGRAKLLGTDLDLRARYEGIDAVKYDVELCPSCGYTALSRYFSAIGSAQAKLIRENISAKVHIGDFSSETYSYEQAMERYKLALACAVVKRGKASEKAYICLKSGWLLRGWRESLQESGKGTAASLKEMEQQEEEYLQNAYKGFLDARRTEGFPMCGMDETTIDYLLAVLASRFQQYDVASRLTANILASSSANARIKEKTRELKEQILADMKKAGQ